MTNTQLRCLVSEMDDDTLRRLRAVINGKLGKRDITPEQQEKMQLARKNAKQKPKSCSTCRYSSEGGCALDAENVCLKSHGWDQNGPYNYACWEEKENDIP